MTGPRLHPVAGAVLTGGASRRMGRNKALVEVDGQPMAVRVARALDGAGCRPVVVIGGDLAALATLGLSGRADDYPGDGPLGAIITALRWSQGSVLVAACDLPWLDAIAVESVASHAQAESDGQVDAVVARTDRLEPLLAWWAPSALRPLEEAFEEGERAVHRTLDRLRVSTVPVASSSLRNVNAPGDLDAV